MVLPLLVIVVFGLPVVFLAWFVSTARRSRQGLIISLVMGAVTVVAGLWAILQSHSSTAGINVLFLPLLGALSALLAGLFRQLRRNSSPAYRAAAWLCLLAGAGLAIALVWVGIRQRQTYRTRDRAYAEFQARLDSDRLTLIELMRDNEGHEDVALDAEIEKHRDDRAFLVVALETPYVSEDRLKALSAFNDREVVLAVAGNPRTQSDTLEKIYRTGSDPPYFCPALAAHKNTPVEVLWLIDGSVTGLHRTIYDGSFARNPSAPRDILDRIAGTGDARLLRTLLANPALDCALLRKAADRLSAADRQDVHSSAETLAALGARLCAAK